MSNQVAVMSLDADDGKIILVVVRLTASPAPPECYANKDQKHSGHMRDCRFVQSEKGEPLTEREVAMVIRTSFALRNALSNIHG